MREFFDSRTRIWAAVAVIVGIGLYIALDLVEDPKEITNLQGKHEDENHAKKIHPKR